MQNIFSPLSSNTKSTAGNISVNCKSNVSHASTDCWTTINQYVGRLSTNILVVTTTVNMIHSILKHPIQKIGYLLILIVFLSNWNTKHILFLGPGDVLRCGDVGDTDFEKLNKPPTPTPPTTTLTYPTLMPALIWMTTLLKSVLPHIILNLKEASWDLTTYSRVYAKYITLYVPVKSKLQHPPPSPPHGHTLGVWHLFLPGREGIWSPLIGDGEFDC